jgi:hypothetical protein
MKKHQKTEKKSYIYIYIYIYKLHVFGFIFFQVLICDFLFKKSQIFKVNPMGWGISPNVGLDLTPYFGIPPALGAVLYT